MAWYEDIDFTAGEVVTESMLDKIPANFATLAPAGDPSQSVAYSCTWAGASSNPAIVNGTLVSVYRRVGGLVAVFIRMTAGSSTTFGSGMLSFTLPVAPAYDGHILNGAIYDSGTLYAIVGRSASTTLNLYHAEADTDGKLNQTTGTAPATLGSGDTIEISGVYLAA